MDKKIIDNKIFDDVFEAIRRLDKSHPILNLKDKTSGYLIRNNKSFKLMGLPDGTIGAFPPNLMFRFYRGENDNFDAKYPCVPKIYRIKNQKEIDFKNKRHFEFELIDRLKITEFTLAAKEFPQVRYAIQDYCNVDFKALAQHYDLNTDLLDMSSDIAVAAFFATNTYDSENGYHIKKDGLGCLRVYMHMPNLNNSGAELESFRLIGLQPFQRPGVQCAFALRMYQDEDFAKPSGKALFRQSSKWNLKLQKAFYEHGKNILFPKEDINDAAELIKNSNWVSKMAVQKFYEDNNFDAEYIEKVLAQHDIRISEKLVYTLSRQQRKKMEEDFKGRPYGDVKLFGRVAC